VPFVVCSLEALQDAPNANEVVTNALAQAMALEVDKAALFGPLARSVVLALLRK